MANATADLLIPRAEEDTSLVVGDLGDLLGFHLRMAQDGDVPGFRHIARANWG